jgi:hypothetical protein
MAMELLKRLWSLLLTVVREPSSWGGIGALLVGYGALSDKDWSLWTGMLSGIVAVVLREHPSNEAPKAEAPITPAPATPPAST